MRGRGYAMSNEYSAEEKRLAVLIDADNVSPAYIKVIIDEATARGIVTYKRIYADWTRNEMQGWKSVLLEYSLTPMQQYSYTTGKNSTDSALIIDAILDFASATSRPHSSDISSAVSSSRVMPR